MAKPKKGAQVTLYVVTNGPKTVRRQATVVKSRPGDLLDLEFQMGDNPPRIMERVPMKGEDQLGTCWEPSLADDPAPEAEPASDPEPEPDPSSDPS